MCFFRSLPKGVGGVMEELLRSALQNGFSIAVAAFLLVRMESRLEALTLAINDLRSVLRPGGNS